MEEGCNMARKFLLIIAALVMAVPSWAGDLVDPSSLRMPSVQDMSMGNILSDYAGTGVFIENDTHDYNLLRMKQMNPDFTTYPESN